MQQAALVTYWFAIALYVGATVLYAYLFLLRRPALSWYATFMTGAAFLVHTVSIGLIWAGSGEPPILGTFNSLSLLAWALVLIYFVVEHVIKIKLYGVFLVPAAATVMVIAQIFGGEGAGRALTEASLQQLDSVRVTIHVVMIMLANAGFALGAAASAIYLLQGSMLKQHKTSALSRRLPSLFQTQTIARRAIAFAFPLYSMGMVLGTIRAIETDVGGWWADPRVMLSGIVWVIFASYLVLIYRKGISGKAAAWIALFGLVAVVILAILARTLPTGFHVFGV